MPEGSHPRGSDDVPPQVGLAMLGGIESVATVACPVNGGLLWAYDNTDGIKGIPLVPAEVIDIILDSLHKDD